MIVVEDLTHWPWRCPGWTIQRINIPQCVWWVVGLARTSVKSFISLLDPLGHPVSLLFLVAAGPVLMTLSNARSVYSTSQQHCNLVECLSSSPSACVNWTLLPTYKMASICRSIIPQNIVFTSFLSIAHVHFYLALFISHPGCSSFRYWQSSAF